MDIRLRPPAPDDASILLDAALESVAESYPCPPWCRDGVDIENARSWVERKIEAFSQGTAYQFAILDASGHVLGACGLNEIDSTHRRANFSYWLRPSAAGRGIMPQAVRLLAEWAFANTDLERLEIVVDVGNVRSQRVAEKAGALREGTLRSRLFTHGQPQDAIMYSLVRETARE